MTLDNCTIDGCQLGVDADYIQAMLLWNCEIKNCISDGYSNVSGHFVDCFIHDNGGVGISLGADNGTNAPGALICIRTICYNNTGKGLNTNMQATATGQLFVLFSHCAFVSNGTSGISIRASMYSVHLDNTIFYGNGAFGIEYVGSTGTLGPISGFCNAFGSNTSGARSNFPALTGDVTLTADPFTSKATGDFSLNSTAGGGAALKAVGFPGTLNAGGAGFANIGVLDPASGGGTTISVSSHTSMIVNRGGVAGY